MELIMKIYGEDIKKLEELNKLGFKSKLVKGGIVIYLKQDDDGLYILPPFKGELRVNITEHGGGYTSTGWATIVCGLKGERLKPYFIPTRGHLACGDHAFFSLRGKFVVVEANRKTTTVSIKYISPEMVNGKAKIIADKIWEGMLEELPDLYSCFKEAATAALNKARCYHCRSPFYILL